MGYDGFVQVFGGFTTQMANVAEWRAAARDIPSQFTASGIPSADTGDKRASILQLQRLFEVLANTTSNEPLPESTAGESSDVHGGSDQRAGPASTERMINRSQFCTFLFLADVLTARELKPRGAVRSTRLSIRPPSHQGVVDRYQNQKIPLFMLQQVQHQSTNGLMMDSQQSNSPNLMASVASVRAPLRRSSAHVLASGLNALTAVDFVTMVQFNSSVVVDEAMADGIFTYCTGGSGHRMPFDGFVMAAIHLGYILSRRGTTSLDQLLQSFSFFVGEPFLGTHAVVYPYPELHMSSSSDVLRALARYSKALARVFEHFARQNEASQPTAAAGASSQLRLSYGGYQQFCMELGVESMVHADGRRRLFEVAAVESSRQVHMVRAARLEKVYEHQRRMLRLHGLSPDEVESEIDRLAASVEPISASDLYLNFDEFLNVVVRLACESSNQEAFAHLPTLSRRVEHLVVSLLGPLYNALFVRDLTQDILNPVAVRRVFDDPTICSAQPDVLDASGDILTLSGSGFGTYGRGVWLYLSCLPDMVHIAPEALQQDEDSAGSASGAAWSSVKLPVAMARLHETVWHSAEIEVSAAPVATPTKADAEMAEHVGSETRDGQESPAATSAAGSASAGSAMIVNASFLANVEGCIANTPEDLLLVSEPTPIAVMRLCLSPITLSPQCLEVAEAAFQAAAAQTSRFNTRLVFFSGFRWLWHVRRLAVGPNNRAALLVAPRANEMAASRGDCLQYLFEQLAFVHPNSASAQPAVGFREFLELAIRLTLTLPDVTVENFDAMLQHQFGEPTTGTNDDDRLITVQAPNAMNDLEATVPRLQNTSFGTSLAGDALAMSMPLSGTSPRNATAQGQTPTAAASKAGMAMQLGGAPSAKSEVLLRNATTHRKQNEMLIDRIKGMQEKLADMEGTVKEATMSAVRVAECFESLAAVADVAVAQLVEADIGRSRGFDQLAKRLQSTVVDSASSGRKIMMDAVPELGTPAGDKLLRDYRAAVLAKRAESGADTSVSTAAAELVRGSVVDISKLRSELRLVVNDAESRLRETQRKLDQERAAATAAKSHELADQLQDVMARCRDAEERATELAEQLEQNDAAREAAEQKHEQQRVAHERALADAVTDVRVLRAELEQERATTADLKMQIADGQKAMQEVQMQRTLEKKKSRRDLSRGDDDSFAPSERRASAAAGGPVATSASAAIFEASTRRRTEEEATSLRREVDVLRSKSAAAELERDALLRANNDAKKRRKQMEAEMLILRKKISSLEETARTSSSAARASTGQAGAEGSSSGLRSPSPAYGDLLGVLPDRDGASPSGGSRRSSFSRWSMDQSTQTNADPDLLLSLINDFNKGLAVSDRSDLTEDPSTAPPSAGGEGQATLRPSGGSFNARRIIWLRSIAQSTSSLRDSLSQMRGVMSGAVRGFSDDISALQGSLARAGMEVALLPHRTAARGHRSSSNRPSPGRRRDSVAPPPPVARAQGAADVARRKSVAGASRTRRASDQTGSASRRRSSSTAKVTAAAATASAAGVVGEDIPPTLTAPEPRAHADHDHAATGSPEDYATAPVPQHAPAKSTAEAAEFTRPAADEDADQRRSGLPALDRDTTKPPSTRTSPHEPTVVEPKPTPRDTSPTTTSTVDLNRPPQQFAEARSAAASRRASGVGQREGLSPIDIAAARNRFGDLPPSAEPPLASRRGSTAPAGASLEVHRLQPQPRTTHRASPERQGSAHAKHRGTQQHHKTSRSPTGAADAVSEVDPAPRSDDLPTQTNHAPPAAVNAAVADAPDPELDDELSRVVAAAPPTPGVAASATEDAPPVAAPPHVARQALQGTAGSTPSDPQLLQQQQAPTAQPSTVDSSRLPPVQQPSPHGTSPAATAQPAPMQQDAPLLSVVGFVSQSTDPGVAATSATPHRPPMPKTDVVDDDNPAALEPRAVAPATWHAGGIATSAGSMDLVVASSAHDAESPTRGIDTPQASATRRSAGRRPSSTPRGARGTSAEGSEASRSERALRLQLAQLEGRRAATGPPAIPDARTSRPESSKASDPVAEKQARAREELTETALASSERARAAARPPTGGAAFSARPTRKATGVSGFDGTLPVPFDLSSSNKPPPPPLCATEPTVTASPVADTAALANATPLLSAVGAVPPRLQPHAPRQTSAGPSTATPRPSRLGSAAGSTRTRAAPLVVKPTPAYPTPAAASPRIGSRPRNVDAGVLRVAIPTGLSQMRSKPSSAS